MRFDLTKRMLTVLALMATVMAVFALAEHLFGSAGFLVAIVVVLLGVPLAIDIAIARESK